MYFHFSTTCWTCSTIFFYALTIRQDKDVVLENVSLSFSGVIVLGTVSCCVAMSCVAMCIKCFTWLFGHRGRRRRIRVPVGSNVSDTKQEEIEGARRTYVVLDDLRVYKSAEQKNSVLCTSEIELCEEPSQILEKRRSGGDYVRTKNTPQAEASMSTAESMSNGTSKRSFDERKTSLSLLPHEKDIFINEDEDEEEQAGLKRGVE